MAEGEEGLSIAFSMSLPFSANANLRRKLDAAHPGAAWNTRSEAYCLVHPTPLLRNRSISSINEEQAFKAWCRESTWRYWPGGYLCDNVRVWVRVNKETEH